VADEILPSIPDRKPMQDKKTSAAFGNIDGLVSKIPNKYLLVNTARVRAQQVVNGAEPLVENANPEKAVSTAFAEIAAGKLEISTEAAPPPEESQD
jgi:DNA-directed RNA polymerase omega subunit